MRVHTFLSSLVLLLCWAVLLAANTVQAGSLFPPANSSGACPNNKVLTWGGDHLDCVDPTPGVSVSCPAGQVLTGIAQGNSVCSAPPANPGTDNIPNTVSCPAGQMLSGFAQGKPICSALVCRQVSGGLAGPGRGNNVVVMCNADEFAMNGGGISAMQCANNFGFLHTSVPWGVGYGGGWGANAWGSVGPSGDGSGGSVWVNDSYQGVCTITYATCCKFVAH